MDYKTRDIPQADRLDKVVYGVEAINAGAHSDKEIAEVIGFTARQARYYRHAAEVLGFILNVNNYAVATDLGKELANAGRNQKINILRNAIYRNGLLKTVVDFIERQKQISSEKEIENVLLSITNAEAHSTVGRRVSTILAWLEYVEIIKEDGDVYIYNDALGNFEDLQAEESIYPANYSQEVDIKEERFSVFELLRKIDQNKIVMNPEFQRNLVWKEHQKSQFIESIILNVPLPPFYFRKELDGKYIIVDGLQRTSTLKEFLGKNTTERFFLSGLNALPDLNGTDFNSLDETIRTRIEDKNLFVYVLQPNVPMVVVYDIFNRINTGGTQLERQEIRNCIFIGNSTNLLKEIAETDAFRNAIDNGISPTRMKDREAILRCLAFNLFSFESDYNNSMDDFLERAMKLINRMQPMEVLQLKNEFTRVMERTLDFFGEANFRLPSANGRGRINIAIMESVCYFFFNKSDDFLRQHKESITQRFYQILLNDSSYIESVRYSTNATSKVKSRFILASQILSGQ